MNAFFVSVELPSHPELVGKPVTVGGAKHGVVSVASYETREFGVNSVILVARALRACPHLTMVLPRPSRYPEVSWQIVDILHDVTPPAEKLSVDEAFLDVDGARRLMGGPVRIATDLRARIRCEVGVSTSIDIATTKHTVKVASTYAEPDGPLLIPHSATIAFLHRLPVGTLRGVGKKARTRLAGQGTEAVGEPAGVGPERLARILDRARRTHLYRLAMRQDPHPAQTPREEKSIGEGEIFLEHVAGRGKLRRILLVQAHTIVHRLRRARLTARTVATKVRLADFTTITRNMAFIRLTDLAVDLYMGVKHLFDSAAISSEGSHLLGLRVEQIVNQCEGVQLALDADSDDGARASGDQAGEGMRQAFGMNPRLGRVEAALDRTRDRFDLSFVGPGSFTDADKKRWPEADRRRQPENGGGG